MSNTRGERPFTPQGLLPRATYTLEVLINFFPNEKVQNLNIIWYYVMEKILLILVTGYTYLYIILLENTYIFIICHKKMEL